MLSQRTGRGQFFLRSIILSEINSVTAKLDDVTRILSELKADLDAKKLSTQRMFPTLYTHTLR